MVKRKIRKSSALFIPKISFGMMNGSMIKISDNSGAKVAQIIGILKYHGRLRRIPKARIGDMCIAAIKKGVPEMRHQKVNIVIIRQRKCFRRMNGDWIQFDDNAAVVVKPDGEPKGSEIRGAVSKEAADRWPLLGNKARIII